MRLHILAASAACAALLAGCGMIGPQYPTFGETSYRIEGVTAGANGSANVPTIIYRDGPKMRVETDLPSYGHAAIVYDESTSAAYVLTQPIAAPALPQPAAAATNPPAAGATTTPATAAPAPAAPTQVVGVAVRVADSDAPQPLETAWAALGEKNARSVGDCEVAGESGHEWQPRDTSQGAERTACITDDGIVLRVREADRVIFEATSLQRGAQSPDLFGIPPGYQTIDPQAVAQHVGETMEQLDSVTGATTPPAAAAPAPAPSQR